MNPIILLSGIHALWRRLARRLRDAARARRDRQMLSAMGAHELRDLGLSHAAAAMAADPLPARGW